MDDEGNSEFMLGAVHKGEALYLMTHEQHQQFLKRIFSHLGDTKRSRATKTFILSRFVPVKTDGQGRMTLPAWLKEEAGIEGKVVLLIQEARIELWAAEKLAELEQSVYEDDEIEDALEAVFAEEERELKSNHRAEGPVEEGALPPG